jgi:kumamolisin
MNPDGSVGGIGGTSATAPMWAGLIARLNQLLGKPLGFLNPILYKNLASGVLRDVSEGDNGAYRAGVGWDACTGLGSPNGTRILAALKGLVK